MGQSKWLIAQHQKRKNKNKNKKNFDIHLHNSLIEPTIGTAGTQLRRVAKWVALYDDVWT
jgi:hypothetical protein